ncbi:MAG: hypothetical protein Q4C67_06085 [Deinococcus sp.]|nr:hypothetical protein [Deinococcus sp.]
MSSPVTIRPRRPEDLPALERVLWAVHCASSYPAAWPPDPAAFIAPPDGDAWVAELHGGVIGQVLLRRPQDSPERS